MKINKNLLLMAFSVALDLAERRYISHSKHVGYISLQLCKKLKIENSRTMDIFHSALLHDIGVGDINLDAINASDKLIKHCKEGKKLVSQLPLTSKSADWILYHHEHTDGSGPFGLKGKEIPIESRIIHIADQFDILFYLKNEPYYKLKEMAKKWVEMHLNTWFDLEIGNAFLSIIETDRFWLDYQWKDFDFVLRREFNQDTIDLSTDDFIRFAEVFAAMIDNRSPFTHMHSRGLADKVLLVTEKFGYDKDKQKAMYAAALLHDLGKMAVPNKLLDKPGALTLEERFIINTHAYYTKIILEQIPNLKTFASWAANHHERKNGQGYPEKLTEKDFSEEERIMAICDVYQALTEERPYRGAMKSKNAWEIIDNMASNDLFDEKLVNRIKNIL